jgi:hypothetical protein
VRGGENAAACELAKVLDRAGQLLASRVDRRDRLRVGGDPILQATEGEQRDGQPLLSSVVQVAFEPSALRVAGRHHAQTRRSQLLDLLEQVAVQAVALQRDAHGGKERVEELALLQEPGCVDDRADLASVVLDRVTTCPELSVRRWRRTSCTST